MTSYNRGSNDGPHNEPSDDEITKMLSAYTDTENLKAMVAQKVEEINGGIRAQQSMVAALKSSIASLERDRSSIAIDDAVGRLKTATEKVRDDFNSMPGKLLRAWVCCLPALGLLLFVVLALGAGTWFLGQQVRELPTLSEMVARYKVSQLKFVHDKDGGVWVPAQATAKLCFPNGECAPYIRVGESS